MVILSLSQLKGIEEHMLAEHSGRKVAADIVVDHVGQEVTLVWAGCTPKGIYEHRHKVSFYDIKYSQYDVLSTAACNGSRHFLEGVNAYEISSSEK